MSPRTGMALNLSLHPYNCRESNRTGCFLELTRFHQPGESDILGMASSGDKCPPGQMGENKTASDGNKKNKKTKPSQLACAFFWLAAASTAATRPPHPLGRLNEGCRLECHNIPD